jgi:hypothetical protein
MKLKDVLNEDWKTERAEYEKRQSQWKSELIKLIKTKKLGNLKPFNIKSDYDFLVEFSVKVDELQLDWALYYGEGQNGKLEVRVEVSSPNKRGSFSKTVTGKNALPINVWKKVEDIYNNAYKYK